VAFDLNLPFAMFALGEEVSGALSSKGNCGLHLGFE